MTAPIPIHETERVAALKEYGVLDTPPEAEFDELVALASEVCQTPVSLITLIDAERQWMKAAVGAGGLTEIPREIAFCSHTILGDELFVVEDATKDPRFSENPLVVNDPSIRFYAGAPLRTESGLGLGSLCVLDRVSRKLSDFQRRTLTTLSKQVEARLRLRLTVTRLEAKQETLQRVQRQRDELAALVVHDLKSPLTAISVSTDFLAQLNEENVEAGECIRDIRLSVDTMQRMVVDMLDVSSAEDGALVARPARFDLSTLLSLLEAGVRSRMTFERRKFVMRVELSDAVMDSDAELIRRVLNNLIDNALKYTPSEGSVWLDARDSGDSIDLRVLDEGAGIEEKSREAVFEKYGRLAIGEAGASRGLGLTFCRLAATAMGGRIWVEANSPRGSAFCLKLPRDARGP